MKNATLFLLILLFSNTAFAMEQKYFFKAEYGHGKGGMDIDEMVDLVPFGSRAKVKYIPKYRGVAVGSRVKNLGMEFEYIYANFRKKFENGDIQEELRSQAQILQVNFYYHPEKFYALSPYLLVGGGLLQDKDDVRHIADNIRVKTTRLKFAAQFGMGAEYMFLEDYSVGFGYRLIGKSPVTSKLKTKNLTDNSRRYNLKHEFIHAALMDVKFYF